MRTREYTIKFSLHKKGFLNTVFSGTTKKETQVVLADSEREAIGRLEKLYSDSSVHIYSCKKN